MKVAILGAGNGGCSAAVDLTLKGFDVTLCSGRSPEHIKEISEKGGMQYSGVLGEGFASFKTSTNIGEAASQAQLIVVATPATAHEFYTRQMSKKLKQETVIMLNPGSTGGALNVARILREEKSTQPRGICETNTLTYACRLQDLSHITIYSVNGPQVFCANLPSKNQDQVLQTVKQAFPSTVAAENVLETSFANINAIMHPAAMILNASLVERTGGDFYFYYEGTTPAVGTLIEAVDQERISAAKTFGLKPRTFVEYFSMAGYTARPDIPVRDAIVSSVPDRYIKSPKSLNHRYLIEDVAYGLVPMAYLARIAQVETPIIDSLIHLSGRLNGVDHWKEGLTLKKMAVDSMDVNGINRYVKEGFTQPPK